MTTDTRLSNEFSITIRTAEKDGVSKYQSDLLKWLDDNASHYVVAYEQKGDLSTQHFQCAVVMTTSRRSDNLKTALVGLLGEQWTPEQKRHAICVNKNRKDNNILLLAGGYCMKQDTNPFIKGWTAEELEPYTTQYEELKQRSEMRNISKDKILLLLQEWYDEFANNKNPDVRDRFERLPIRKKLDYMYQYGISQGADLQKYSTPVWINYFINNFRVLFERFSASRLFIELSESPV